VVRQAGWANAMPTSFVTCRWHLRTGRETREYLNSWWLTIRSQKEDIKTLGRRQLSKYLGTTVADLLVQVFSNSGI